MEVKEELKFEKAELELLKTKGMPFRLWKLLYRHPNYIIVCNRANGNVRALEFK